MYRTSVLPVLRDLFAQGRRRPRDLFEVVDTGRVDDAAIRAVDPQLSTLANLNTPEANEADPSRLLAILAPLIGGGR